ncbi:hypothetical protein D3C76_1588810 [compost metagenome]
MAATPDPGGGGPRGWHWPGAGRVERHPTRYRSGGPDHLASVVLVHPDRLFGEHCA